jgi:23S rRNA G2445 N2-methylase RlmL
MFIAVRVTWKRLNALDYVEIETPLGLEDITAQELKARGLKVVNVDKQRVQTEAFTPFMNRLKGAIAIYQVLVFPVARPKALLGHEHFKRLARTVSEVKETGAFQTLRLSAAGEESTVMQRLRDEIASAAGLTVDQNGGDMLVRVRPSASRTSWEVLIRSTPRPLATRAWRTHNMEGALNACVAYCMANLCQLTAQDTLLNVCCGSGTLLIESLSFDVRRRIGVDNATHALEYAQRHLENAQGVASLVQADVTQLPFPKGAFSAFLGDLPFGQLVGDAKTNEHLYPAILREMWRVGRDSARAVLVTHAIRTMEQSLMRVAPLWKTERVIMTSLNGLHPRLYVLVKQSR